MKSNMFPSPLRVFFGGALIALSLGGVAGRATAAPNADAQDPILRSAELMPKAVESLILDLAINGTRRIAVGERGHVLLSDDGQTWTQVADVPTRATLTSVTARGDQAWAVGHDGVIIRSADGGKTWSLVNSNPYNRDVDDPHNGTPLLDVLFIDDQRGFAIGAYAWMLATDDSGQSWRSVDLTSTALGNAEVATDEMIEEEAIDLEGEENNAEWLMDADDIEIDEESDPHLNAMARLADGTLFIVAERGAGFRSVDNGQTWERSTLPYDGSMFGLLAFDSSRLLAFGLRGNALESVDAGLSWTPVATGTQLSLFGGAALPDGGALLVGANGVTVKRANAGEAFRTGTFVNERNESPILAAVLAEGDGRFIVTGERGIGIHRAE